MSTNSSADLAGAANAIASDPLRVALAGGFGNGNFGNDASLEAAIIWLRAGFPDASLSCICDDPAVVTERFAVAATEIAKRPRGVWKVLDNLLLRLPSGAYNWARAFSIARQFDAVVFPGTGIFDDYRTGPMGFPAQVFRWSVVSRMVGARVIFFSSGAGPIINPLSRFFLKTAATCAQYRSYRDAGSRDFMASIGVEERDSPIVPDIVFSLPTSAPSPVRSTGPLTIGLGVMSYRGWRIDEAIGEDYLSKLVRFVRYAEGEGHRVRLLVAEPSDKRALKRLNDTLGDDVDRGGADMETLHDVMNAVGECDVVVASRYHVLIAALKLGRPCVSLSYGPKHDMLMAEAGLADFCQFADRFDFDVLVRHFETLAGDPARYSAEVRQRVAEFVARLDRAKDRLLFEVAP